MAVCNNPNGFTGTIGCITIYKMHGKRFVRTKSSLTRNRVLKSRAFEKTRRHAASMGRAAKIGSEIYKAIPAGPKDRRLYQAITGEAASLLYQGKSIKYVQQFLWEKYIAIKPVKEKAVQNMTGKNIAWSTQAINRRLWNLLSDQQENQTRFYYFKHTRQKSTCFTSPYFQDVMELLE